MDLKSFLILKFFFLLTLYFNPIVEGDATYGLCANSECSEPVGKGVTMLRYASPDDNRISFEPNEDVMIYVKDYGPKKDLWGVIVRGTRGYISKKFIRETQSFIKQLVVAHVEFKSAVLVTNAYTVTSHVHVSSNHHQTGSHLSQAESVIHTQTLQQDFVNSAPSSQKQLWSNNPNENLQPSHPSFNSLVDNTQFGLHSNFDPSSQISNVPEHSSHSHHDSGNSFISSHATGIKSEHILPSQSLIPGGSDSVYQNDPLLYSSNLESGLNSVHNFDPKSPSDFSQNGIQDPKSFYPSETYQSFNQHPSSVQQLSQQEFQSLYSSEIHISQHSPSIQQQQNQQFQSQQSPEMYINQHPSSIQQQEYQQQFQYPEHSSSIQQQQVQQQQFQYPQQPSGIQQQQVQQFQYPQQSSSIQQQQVQQQQQPPYASEIHIDQHLSSVQHQEQPPYVPEMHLSFHSADYYSPVSDEDLSKTYAMLSDRGIDDNYLYSNSYSESQGYHTSQDIKAGFDMSVVEVNIVPSQSQHSPMQSNEALLHPSLNSYPNIIESKIAKADALEENINKRPENTDFKTEGITADKMSTEKYFDEENEELASEVLAETDDESEEDDDDDDEDDEEGLEDIAVVDDVVSSSKDSESIETTYLKSSMSSTLISEEISKINEGVKSSVESSSVDSNLVDTLNKEQNMLVKGKIPSLNEPISPSTDDMRPEKISSSQEIMHTKTLSSVDEHIEMALKKDTPGKISDVSFDAKKNLTNSDIVEEKNFEAVNSGIFSDRNNNEALQAESVQENTIPPIDDFFMENDQNSELNKIVNTVDIDGVGDSVRSTYQIRNLKGEYTSEEQQSNESGSEENNTDKNSNDYSSFQNGLRALKSFVDTVMSWIPEPLYTVIMDLQNKGISPRVPVFTMLFGIICILLIVPLFYIKECSKESKLITELANIEKKAYTLSATNNILEEKLESVQSELSTLQASLKEEKVKSEDLKSELENQADELEHTKSELENCLEEIDLLKEKENEYLTLLNDHEKEKENLLEHKNSLDKIITDQENSIESLTNQLLERENTLKDLENEKTKLLQMKEDYEEKIALFDQNCKQLLQEAEVWNLRVNELTLKVNEETTLRNDLEACLKEKNEEMESLKQLVETFKTFEEIEDSEEEEPKTKEEKLQSLINSSKILNQLKKEEDKNKVFEEQLTVEKNKILDMEVELLDARSEIDKLKMNYNQALQDKAEAQTKLEVLTNYFKDKEIQLQKQLGAQEAVRQRTEEDASSAERRICLIEQENSSYKYQVASMKQEMEETERNLKSQIAVQEKKAHENWIAARAAERKLEDMKQEVTQLRQRLTLLEREQENWVNSTRDDIIRPVPKRVTEESGSQDMNASERGMFPLPPPLHDRLPPVPPMLLPPDRPLPPLPPPPMFLPPMERHFRHQPWHLPPDPSSEYRTTPPEFIGGSELTPPRGRQSTITDGDTGPNTSSPLTTDTRDSRNSTPPHFLPDFHDVPPQPGRPFFPPPPPLGHPRLLPMPPPYRRDPLPKRLDSSNEYNSRGSQQPPNQEQWQHSRV